MLWLGVVLSVLAAVMYLPQAWRLLRSGDARGVSRLGVLNSLVSTVAWAFYLWRLEDWPLLASTLVPLLPLGVVLWFARGNGGRLFPAALWAGVVFGAACWDLVALGVVLSGSIVLFYGPVALSAWRSPLISGISLPAWVLCLVEALLSVWYGLLGGSWAVVAYGGFAAVGAACVVAAAAWRRDARVEIPSQRTAPPVSAPVVSDAASMSASASSVRVSPVSA